MTLIVGVDMSRSLTDCFDQNTLRGQFRLFKVLAQMVTVAIAGVKMVPNLYCLFLLFASYP